MFLKWWKFLRTKNVRIQKSSKSIACPDKALYEQGNVSQFGGVLVRTVPNNDDGSFDLDYLETLLHGGIFLILFLTLFEKKILLVDDPHFPRARLICIEVSHNMMGGAVPSLEWLLKVKKFQKFELEHVKIIFISNSK